MSTTTPNNVRILGIDPGYDRCGLAIVEKTKGQPLLIQSMCVETSKKDAYIERLHNVGKKVTEWIHTYNPNYIGIETVFFENNQKTAMKIAEVRGMILFIAQEHHIPVHEYTPPQIKVAVAGHGGANKDDIIRMIPHLLRVEKKIAHDDEYDALATALTCAAHIR